MDARLAEARAALEGNRRDEAIAILAALLSEAPNQTADVYMDLCRQLYLSGRMAETDAWTARGLAQHPVAYDLLNLRGVVLRVGGRPAEALQLFDRAVAVNALDPRAQANRGSVLLELGQVDQALSVFAEVSARAPQDPAHRTNLALALQKLGRFDEAAAQLRQALAQRPDFTDAWMLLAALSSDQGRYAEAEAILDQALTAQPSAPRLLKAKVLVMRFADQGQRALTFLETIVPLLPNEAWAHLHLGDLLAQTDRARSLVHLRRATALDPRDLDHVTVLIQTLERAAYPDEGAALEEAYQLAHSVLAPGATKPGQTKLLKDVFARVCAFDEADALGDFSTLGRSWAQAGLQTALIRQLAAVRSNADRTELVEQHRIWGRDLEAVAAQTPLRRPPPRPRDDRIRLGFMSSDLRRHPVAWFAQPLFDHVDRERFALYAYSFYTGQEDATQARIASQVEAFRWTPETTDRRAAQMIADDDLDMLIELGGSTHMNRLGTMAWRPAPLQASWLGYPHSSGLSTIDYFVCDPWNRPTDPALLIETPLVLPRSWVALGEVFASAPLPRPGLPEVRTGALTFGTANQPYKFTALSLSLWARIVARVPGARFALLRPEAGAETFRRNVLAAFAAEGVDASQVTFHPVRGEHLPLYDEIDISLDTFPLTGGVTTVESLWMGVPVISLRGPAFYERLSWSLLNSAGLADLCVEDLAGYEAAALALAADRDRRARLRTGLRGTISQSPLGDGPGFARDFYAEIEAVVKARVRD